MVQILSFIKIMFIYYTTITIISIGLLFLFLNVLVSNDKSNKTTENSLVEEIQSMGSTV